MPATRSDPASGGRSLFSASRRERSLDPPPRHARARGPRMAQRPVIGAELCRSPRRRVGIIPQRHGGLCAATRGALAAQGGLDELAAEAALAAERGLQDAAKAAGADAEELRRVGPQMGPGSAPTRPHVAPTSPPGRPRPASNHHTSTTRSPPKIASQAPPPTHRPYKVTPPPRTQPRSASRRPQSVCPKPTQLRPEADPRYRHTLDPSRPDRSKPTQRSTQRSAATRLPPRIAPKTPPPGSHDLGSISGWLDQRSISSRSPIRPPDRPRPSANQLRVAPDRLQGDRRRPDRAETPDAKLNSPKTAIDNDNVLGSA